MTDYVEQDDGDSVCYGCFTAHCKVAVTHIVLGAGVNLKHCLWRVCFLEVGRIAAHRARCRPFPCAVLAQRVMKDARNMDISRHVVILHVVRTDVPTEENGG